MRRAAAILYFVFVAICAGRAGWTAQHRHSSDSIGWLTTRPLVAGRQLTADDVRRPLDVLQQLSLPPLDSLVGRHLKHSVAVDAVILPEDTELQPGIPPGAADRVLVTTSLTASELASVAPTTDPGTRLHVCSGGKDASPCLATPRLTVVAVHRDGGAPPSGWMTLAVPRDSTKPVLDQLAIATRVFVIAATARSSPVPMPTGKPLPTHRH